MSKPIDDAQKFSDAFNRKVRAGVKHLRKHSPELDTWIGESGLTVPGVSTISGLTLGGTSKVPIEITWDTIGGGTTTYPNFLRFRVRVKTTDNTTVEQPCLVRILGPAVPRSSTLSASN